MGLNLTLGSGAVAKVANPAPASASTAPATAVTSESTEKEVAEGVIEPEVVMYSSYPLQAFSIGTRWHFEKSVLKVTPEDAELIDKYLLKADSRTKQLVKKIDAKLAEARVRELTRAAATKSIGSEVGHEGTMVTQVGTVPIDASQE
jgi:hypothetical protein